MLKLIKKIISSILDLFTSNPDKNDFVLKFKIELPENLNIFGVEKMELKEGQKSRLTVELKTRRGNPASIEPGSVLWTSSDETVCSVTPDAENELSATVEGLDGSENESVVIEFRADADKSENVREIVGTLPVTVTQGDAMTVEISAGEPFEETETEPGGGENAPETGPETETPES